MDSLGKKIENLRRNAGMTQEDLAEAIDVTRQGISQWELDIVIPKADKLKLLCEYFNVKPEYLLFDNSEKEPLIKPTEEAVATAAEETAATPAEEVVVTTEQEVTEEVSAEPPKKKSLVKRVLIIGSVIVAALAAAIMIFIAWLEAPSDGVDASVSSSSVRFDLATVLQILAGIILFVLICVAVVYVIKYIKNRRK